jgi:hypothetical protein
VTNMHACPIDFSTDGLPCVELVKATDQPTVNNATYAVW